MLQLRRFPDIPVSTPEEARGSSHLQRSSVSSSKLEMRDPSMLPREEFLAFPTHLKRRRAAQERREELMGRATIPRVPQMSQSIPEDPVFPALLRLARRGSRWQRRGSRWYVGEPCGKASWESHRSLDPRDGKRDTSATLSLRSRWYVESTCRNSRKSRRFSAPVEMRPIFSAASRE